MKTFSYTITDEIGLHARPAGLLVKAQDVTKSLRSVGKHRQKALLLGGGQDIWVKIDGKALVRAATRMQRMLLQAADKHRAGSCCGITNAVDIEDRLAAADEDHLVCAGVAMCAGGIGSDQVVDVGDAEHRAPPWKSARFIK